MKNTASELESVMPTATGVCAEAAERLVASATARASRPSKSNMQGPCGWTASFGEVSPLSTDAPARPACEIVAPRDVIPFAESRRLAEDTRMQPHLDHAALPGRRI